MTTPARHRTGRHNPPRLYLRVEPGMPALTETNGYPAEAPLPGNGGTA